MSATHTRKREDRHCQGNDAHTTEPLGHISPKEQAFGQYFDVTEDCCAGGGKTGHGFKKSIGKAFDVSGGKKREASEESEADPAKIDKQKTLPGGQALWA